MIRFTDRSIDLRTSGLLLPGLTTDDVCEGDVIVGPQTDC
jgi:hypothetical protein